METKEIYVAPSGSCSDHHELYGIVHLAMFSYLKMKIYQVNQMKLEREHCPLAINQGSTASLNQTP